MYSVDKKIKKIEEAIKDSQMTDEERGEFIDRAKVFFEYEKYMTEKLGVTPKEVQKIFGDYMTNKLTQDMSKFDVMSDEERKSLLDGKTQQEYFASWSLKCMEDYAQENGFPKWDKLSESFIGIAPYLT